MMQLLPSQFAMSLLLYGVPMTRFESNVERVASARNMLIQMTNEDFGYDAQAWHDFLVKTNHCGYRSTKSYLTYQKTINRALADAEWKTWIAEAEATNLHQLLTDRTRRRRDASDTADREWGGKGRRCPKCAAWFKSVKDRGQCPACSHVFYASHPDIGNTDWTLSIE